MKQLLAIGASNSKNSINKAFASFVAHQLPESTVTTIDLNDFEMPLFSVDCESVTGIPAQAKLFFETIQKSDAIVISFAEHNGSYSASFKNLLDWTTRIDQKLWQSKPMLLLATSPGGRGGATVLESAKQTFPHLGAKVVGSFALPSYYEKFSAEKGILDPQLNESFQKEWKLFADQLN